MTNDFMKSFVNFEIFKRWKKQNLKVLVYV